MTRNHPKKKQCILRILIGIVTGICIALSFFFLSLADHIPIPVRFLLFLIISFVWLIISQLGIRSFLIKTTKEISKSSENELMETVKTNMDSRSNYLMNQINPHFLYNTLESIRGKAIIDGNEKIADMVEALSHFFRYNISNNRKIVSLADELENVEAYIKIQRFRFDDRFQLKTMIEVDPYSYHIPKMSLQPIVENSIMHGLEKKMEAGTIEIRIFESETELIINIEDDGVGMEEKELEMVIASLEKPMPDKTGGTGIALYNVNARLKLLYGESYGIRIYSIASVGTTVVIRIPKDSSDAIKDSLVY